MAAKLESNSTVVSSRRSGIKIKGACFSIHHCIYQYIINQDFVHIWKRCNAEYIGKTYLVLQSWHTIEKEKSSWCAFRHWKITTCIHGPCSRRVTVLVDTVVGSNPVPHYWYRAQAVLYIFSHLFAVFAQLFQWWSTSETKLLLQINPCSSCLFHPHIYKPLELVCKSLWLISSSEAMLSVLRVQNPSGILRITHRTWQCVHALAWNTCGSTNTFWSNFRAVDERKLRCHNCSWLIYQWCSCTATKRNKNASGVAAGAEWMGSWITKHGRFTCCCAAGRERLHKWFCIRGNACSTTKHKNIKTTLAWREGSCGGSRYIGLLF